MAATTSTTSARPTITDPSAIQAQNRGPITSLFAPPASCTATLTSQQSKNSGMFFGHNNDPYFDASCYPLGTLSPLDLVNGKGKDKWSMYYYSPAICPYGWTTAATFESRFPGNKNDIYPDPETTAALCCPSGYNDKGHRCVSVAQRDERIEYVSPTVNGAEGWIRGLVSTTTVASEISIWGDGIPIWWQTSDEALLAAALASTTFTYTSSPSLSGPKVQSSGEPNTSRPANTSTNESTSAQRGSLSARTKVGIGVSIAVFVLGAVLAGVFLASRRKARGTEKKNLKTECPYELGCHSPVEKPAESFPQEMSIQAEPVELHAHTYSQPAPTPHAQMFS